MVIARNAGSVLAVRPKRAQWRLPARISKRAASRLASFKRTRVLSTFLQVSVGWLLDPPRAGAAEASEKLVRSRARHVAYVSCDASTLARDARTLVSGGFRLTSVDTFEMFPHTSHVEILALFERDPRQRPKTKS